MSGAEIVHARFVQRVDEFTQPLAVEVLAEADRLTWRLWEPLEALRLDCPVGQVTQKQYRVHPSGALIPKSHSLSRRGQPSPYILPVRLDMPSGHTETIDGVQWGLVDEIALDPQDMRAKPRMYGEHLSDWAAWMFVLCTDTWRFMTPFNRHVLTRSSRVDSEGFTALSLPLTKARPLHLVAGSCLVPWHESPLKAQMVLRINAHPGGPLWTNLQVDVQQAWDAERLHQQTAALQQSLQVAQVQTRQEQINQRITIDHDTRKTQLQRLWQPPKASADPVAVSPDSPNSQSVPAGLRTGADRLRDSTSSSSLGPVPAHAQPATGVDAAAAHAVPDPAIAQIPVSCEQLASDAAQATLMVLSFQRWYAEQAKAAEKP